MDWSCKGISVPASHVNSSNHDLHWELCWLFFAFSVALHYQVRFFPSLIPSPSLQRKYHEIFLQRTVFDFTGTGSWPHRLFSSPCKEWGECAKGHQKCFSAWKLRRNDILSLWNKQATVARRPRCFPTLHHHIRILPREAPSHAMCLWDGRTVGRGDLCQVFSVNKERGFELLKFLSCEFCFIFSSNQDIYGKDSKDTACCSWSCISAIPCEHELCTSDCRLNKSFSHTPCILR